MARPGNENAIAQAVIDNHKLRHELDADLGLGATENVISDEISRCWDETSVDGKQSRKNIYKRNWEPYLQDMALYKAFKASQGGQSSASPGTVNAQPEDTQYSDAETDNSESTTESDGKDEEEAVPEEEIKSPSPTPRKMPTPKAIKSVATKRNTKKALDRDASSGTSTRAKPATPAVVGTNDQAEPANRGIASTGKEVEVERDSDKLTRQRIGTRRWGMRCN
ncbi:hypothetical protein HOY82DRAFT_536708 [Tuber indicum]|nr:hypothetical protein HOY82DRAFT_536708 [Tuber indicum]